MREVVRFQDAYDSFQSPFWPFDETDLLISETGFQFSYYCVFINIFRKTRHIIKDSCFSENEVSEYHFPSSRDILGQIVIEMNSGKLKLHNLGSFIFKIVVLN